MTDPNEIDIKDSEEIENWENEGGAATPAPEPED